MPEQRLGAAAPRDPEDAAAAGDPASGRKVLVVSTVEVVDERLGRHLDPADTVKLVVPAVGQGVIDWLANDERAFAAADDAADRMAESLPGTMVDSGPGEADLGLAIRDALATFAADEIIVAVPVHDDELDASIAAARSALGPTIGGVPVRIVVTGAA